MFFSICISVLCLLMSHLRSILCVFAQKKTKNQQTVSRFSNIITPELQRTIKVLTLTFVLPRLSCEVCCHLVRGNASCHTGRPLQVNSAQKHGSVAETLFLDKCNCNNCHGENGSLT